MAIALITGISRNNIGKLSVGCLLFLATFAPIVLSDTGDSWNRLPAVLSTNRFDLSSWRLMQELVVGGADSGFFLNRLPASLDESGWNLHVRLYSEPASTG